MIEHKTPKSFLSLTNIALAIIFLLLWIAPIIFIGLTLKPILFLPPYFSYQSNISCLFESEALGWSNTYFQIQLKGQQQWLNVPEEDYTQLEPFGYRTRLGFILSINYNSDFKDLESRRDQLAVFIKRRYEEINPTDIVGAVRFLRIEYPLGDNIPFPNNHWLRPSLETIPSDQYKIKAVIQFDE